MELVFLGIIITIFLLAIFDLSVGVSNDAVNFLNSAIGSKAASFRVIIIIASVGVFIGAAMSNGMMDIARHGIFRPEHFSFYELMCIFMAVMVTDIILLDIFNSVGLPTSTTVSLVFELLGAAFAVAIVKIIGDAGDLGINDLLNTEKALSVILGIFLSVAIAFFFGTVVQFITRMIFSFGYKSTMKWKIGLFGGVATTAIIYFLLLKGIKDMAFMTPELKGCIHDNTIVILAVCFLFFTVLMQVLYFLKVNVLKVVVLIGTFSLAMAFAGNDLVNFIGVPLSGLSSYTDYVTNGAGDPHSFMMGSLNGPSDTPFYFLAIAGTIMVISLATSKKALNVSKTEIGLGSRDAGDEMFGSSRAARKIVRMVLSFSSWLRRDIPKRVLSWLNGRFDTEKTEMEDGAAFDLIRGAVNLTLAGMLIAVGTSLKLPLSTTFVTFMVAMGTSLADRAWGRESAVFRITGVISVIGGWFITAGAAFIGAAVIVLVMHQGGYLAMIAGAVIAVVLLIKSNIRFKNRKKEDQSDSLFQTILTTRDKKQAWNLLSIYMGEHHKKFLLHVIETYSDITSGFINDKINMLSKSERELYRQKSILKGTRRKETLCLRYVSKEIAIEKNTWLHLANNSCMAMNYNMRHINEVCKEHVENNFRVLPSQYKSEFDDIRSEIMDVLNESLSVIDTDGFEYIAMIRRKCDKIKDAISVKCRLMFERLRDGDPADMAVLYVYLNMLQESQEMMSNLRKLLRSVDKLHRQIGI